MNPSRTYQSLGPKIKAGANSVPGPMYPPMHLIEKNGKVRVLDRGVSQTLNFITLYVFLYLYMCICIHNGYEIYFLPHPLTF